ncbi:MAG: carbohydrate binding domain-containing protein, partial [Armatimonadia bacterium]
IDFADISVHLDEPTATPLAEVMPFAPDGWALDTVNGYSDIEAATEFGDNLLSNASFETLTGSGTPDNFANWTEYISGSQDIQQAGGAQSGSYCLEFTSKADGSNPYITQAVACDDGMTYRLAYWTKGDGTHQAAHVVYVSQDSGATYYKIIAVEDSGVTGTTWTEITRDITTPTGSTHIMVGLLGPYNAVGTAYVDNVSLRKRFGGEVMEEFAGESVLSALVTVAEQTGEHFTLSPNGREVLWLRKDAPDSGVRAIGGIEGVAARDNNKICLITDLTEVHNAYELASRVYPYGGGVGSDRVTLADCTRAAPTGYTLSTTDNYLKRDDAETALGRIDRIQNWADVNAYSSAISHRQFAANQLFDRAYEWLSTHSATNTARNSDDPVISYDTFTRANGAAVGSTETVGPAGEALDAYTWTETTYSVSSNTAVNTPTLGSNLITTPAFDADPGGWTKDAVWTIAGGVGVHAGAAGFIYQASTLTTGTWYRCDWTVASLTPDSGRLYAMFGGSTILSAARSTAATFIDTFRATGASAGIGATTGAAATIDNVTFKAITLKDLFATQSSATAEVSIDVTMPSRTVGTQNGIVARLDSATSPTTFIIAYQTYANTTQQVRVDECVGGTYTNLATYTSDFAANQVLRMRCEGGVVTVSKLAAAGVDGAEGAETRLGSCYTTVLTGTLHGLFSTQSGNTLDNVKITQLDATGYDVPRAYRLTVAKLNRLLLPGYTVRVQYQKRIGDYVVFDIDEDMHVLGSTVRIDDGGMRTVALEVATVRAPILTDADYIANEIKQARYARSRTQGAQGLNDGTGGIAYAMGVRDGRIVNIARQTPVADGTYASVTVVNGVITAGS